MKKKPLPERFGEQVWQDIRRIERGIGRRLNRSERQSIANGEHILPAGMTRARWLVHPANPHRRPIRILQGGAPDSNRRRH